MLSYTHDEKDLNLEQLEQVDMQIPGIDLVEEIGRGRFGIVYRGIRKGQPFAVKIQRADLNKNSVDERRRFLREAVTLARIKHPGLPAVMAVGEVKGRRYFVMEYVEGPTLASALEVGPLSEELATALAQALAGALSEVHRYGLVHRDLKPHNILFDRLSGRVALVDFGFATSTRAQNNWATVGTLLYSSPEQTGILKRPLDGRSDLYSLGAVLFEAATGAPPLQSSNIEELAQQHAVVVPPDVRSLRPTISRGLAAIIAKLLAKDPDDRYQSAEGLAADLSRLSGLNETFDRQEQVILDAHDRLDQARDPMPLIGREEQLNELKRAWFEARHGDGRIGLIKGPPGSGKSRLMREFLRFTRDDDALVLSAKCSETATAPLAPLRAAIDGWLEDVPESEARQKIEAAAGDALPLFKRFSPRLARLLADIPDSLKHIDSQDRFYDVICDLILGLCRVEGLAFLFFDDVQWMDPATLRVLERVTLCMRDFPLLMIGAARTEAAGDEALARLSRNAHAAEPVRLSVEALDEQAVERLLASHLGVATLDPAISNHIAAQSQGIPFAVEEYLNAMLDSGLLRPEWGTWVADPKALESGFLPENVLQLIIERMSHFDSRIKEVLTTAALLRVPLRADVLAAVCGVDEAETSSALTEAVGERILKRASGDQYEFVHDRLRDALLSTLESQKTSARHHRIAQALDSLKTTDRDHVYALADHYYLGAAKEEPARAYEANCAAGTKATQHYAFDQAYVFYSHAAEIAEDSGIPTRAEFQQIFAEACLRTGRMDEAAVHCNEALRKSKQRIQRTSLRLMLVKIHLGQLDTVATHTELELAFAELGRTFHSPSVFRLLVSGVGLLLTFSAKRMGFPVDRMGVKDHEIHSLIAALYWHAGFMALLNADQLALLQYYLRGGISAIRLESSREVAEWYWVSGVLGAMFHAKNLSVQLQKRAIEIAEAVEDPVLSAKCHCGAALATHWFIGGGPEHAHAVRACLKQHGRWLDNFFYLSGCADLAWNLLLRGYAEEAWSWIQIGVRRIATEGERSALTQGHTFRCYAGPTLAALGRPQEGRQHLDDFKQLITDAPYSHWRWGAYLAHRALFYVEQRELGQELEKVLATRQELGLPVNRTPSHLRLFYIAQAWGRLLQYERAKGAQRVQAQRRCRQALRQLKKAAFLYPERCHQLTIEAAMYRLDGRHRTARKRLVVAKELALESDNPWILFEVSCEHARMFQEQGNRTAAMRKAQDAHRLAAEHGWVLRARRIRSEFALSDFPGITDARSGSLQVLSTEPRALQLRRSLDALLQVSLASVRVFDPQELARLALDELVRILGAERAFLFLSEDDGETLLLAAGRNAGGEDISERSDYSKTIVQEVRRSRQPNIVGAATHERPLASESIVAHDLRSILAAPLLMRERLLGVVYLDTRLARGMFTSNDVDILLGVANQIAISVENARAAQLKATLGAERAQRKLAEQVQAVSSSLNSSLDLQTVLQRFVKSVTQLVPYDRAFVFVREEDRFRLAVMQGTDKIDHLPDNVDPGGTNAELEQILKRRKTVAVQEKHETSISAYLYGKDDTECSISVPLVRASETVGVLIVESFDPNRYTEKDAGLISAVAAQAATAIENARLFGQVQRQATTDPLTEVYNRAHFLKLAEQELLRARRYRRPAALAIFDIDNFKKINDTVGHLAGDEVIREVLRRTKASCRSVDFLGRYGGDEFMVFFVESDAKEARVAAEHIRSAVYETPVAIQSIEIRVSISVGITCACGEFWELLTLIKAADAALLEAKTLGRNRVESR